MILVLEVAPLLEHLEVGTPPLPVHSLGGEQESLTDVPRSELDVSLARGDAVEVAFGQMRQVVGGGEDADDHARARPGDSRQLGDPWTERIRLDVRED